MYPRSFAQPYQKVHERDYESSGKYQSICRRLHLHMVLDLLHLDQVLRTEKQRLRQLLWGNMMRFSVQITHRRMNEHPNMMNNALSALQNLVTQRFLSVN